MKTTQFFLVAAIMVLGTISVILEQQQTAAGLACQINNRPGAVLCRDENNKLGCVLTPNGERHGPSCP